MLRNIISNTINADLPTIFAYLFKYYGIIEDDDMTERENEANAIEYNLCNPIFNIFDALDDLR